MKDNNHNVTRKPDYNQVCVWPGCGVLIATENQPLTEKQKQVSVEEFEKYMKDTRGWRVQYLEEISTYPDTDEVTGQPIADTGGRIDLFFALHKDDIGAAAVPRLQMGIRWIEDVLAPINYHSKIYPDRVRFYQTWPLDGTIIEPLPNVSAWSMTDPDSTTEEVFTGHQPKAVAAPIEAPTTKENTMTDNNTTPEVAQDPMQQLASSLLALLKPQLKTLIAEQVRDAIDTMGLTNKNDVESIVGEMNLVSQSDLEESTKDLISERDLSEEVEQQLGNENFITELTTKVTETMDMDELFTNLLEGDKFDDAVREVVEQMEFSVEVSSSRTGRRNRY